jgi:hypothetical protein
VEHAIGTGQATFAVIGCGAVGLATARLLQQRGYEVTIYARDLPPQTTSNAAGALWSPGTLFMAERATPEFLAQFDRATRLSYRYFQDLVGDYYGVRWLHGYSIGDGPSATFVGGRHRARFRDLYPGLTVLSERQNPFRTRYADRFQSMLIEPAIYLNALLRDFLLMRGRLVVRDFDDADKLLEIPESTLVNCTGLGARELFGDKDFCPGKRATIIRATSSRCGLRFARGRILHVSSSRRHPAWRDA